MDSDAAVLLRIEQDRPNFRGQCSLCKRLSFRWGTWRHVELWFKKHKCVDRKKKTDDETRSPRSPAEDPQERCGNH